MTEPGHSFAVLAHGRSPFLEQCLRSLEQQTCRSAIYIATSTPSDHISGIATRHQVPLLVNTERAGIAADWSYAYGKCRTEYLTLAHQDDWYLPEYTRQCLAIAHRHPDCLIVFTDYREFHSQALRTWSRNMLVKRLLVFASFGLGSRLANRSGKRRLLSLGCAIPCPSVMFHAGRIGPFHFSPEFQINLDWDAWLRLAEQDGSFCRVPRAMMVHRRHEGSQTARGVIDGHRQAEDRMMFERQWPHHAAEMLAKLYALSLVGRER